jgi:hypothetical protein
MSDPSFEARLERLYAQSPRVTDAEGFARRVESRLDREWSLRRVLIGAAGVAGGTVAVTQMVGAQMSTRLAGALEPLNRSVSQGWQSSWYADLQTGGLFSGDAVWILTALAGLGLSLAVARMADAF